MEFQNRILRHGVENPNVLVANPQNWRKHPAMQQRAITEALSAIGWIQSVIVNERTGRMIDGHLRVEQAVKNHEVEVPVVYVDLSEEEELQALATLDPIGAMASADKDVLQKIMEQVTIPGDTLSRIIGGLTLGLNLGFDEKKLNKLLGEAVDEEAAARTLSERFGVPPFSVLDARQGYWQKRKTAWLNLGIQSEVGRGENLLKFSDRANEQGPKRRLTYVAGTRNEEALDEVSKKILESGSGTSIFDPVLCELAYRWFAPLGGVVLDPFAGGSVRGIVAAKLGREYHGIDLSTIQVEANRQQAATILGQNTAIQTTYNPVEQTAVEKRGVYYFKRDDLFVVGGANGGKVRALLELLPSDTPGIVACGDRVSTMLPRVAAVAAHLGKPCRLHTASGEMTPSMGQAASFGAELVQHDPGYLTVIKKRAADDAEALGWFNVPWALEMEEAVSITARQTGNLPREAKRIVVPVGSGMSLAGVLHGMKARNNPTPVLGVVLDHLASVEKRLDKYAPEDWRKMCTLVPSDVPFHDAVENASLEGVPLDPYYEAKCIPFMQEDDCLWIVGHRDTPTPLPKWYVGDSKDIESLEVPEQVDMIFTCPPYADLEVYSDDPRDLSTMPYTKFATEYTAIIHKAAQRLKDNRFAVIVVGEVRDKDGNYYGFVPATINAFEEAGLFFYNEAILVTAIGSLPIRAGKQFDASRKFGKTHQNVLVFVKGDSKAATMACGPVDMSAVVWGEQEAENDGEVG